MARLTARPGGGMLLKTGGGKFLKNSAATGGMIQKNDIGYRGVYADLGTKVLLDDTSVAVHGYPTAWIARNSSDELTLRGTDQHAPARLAQTLRSDIIASVAWLDRTYSSLAAALQRLGSGDRNGVRVGTPKPDPISLDTVGTKPMMVTKGGRI